MSITLEEAAERIIVCGVHDVERIFHTQPVSAIISIGDDLVLRLAEDSFDFTQTIHMISKFQDQLFYRNMNAGKRRDEALKVLELEIEAASELLLSDNKKLLIHCHAGAHSSPSFTLFLLCHLQGDNPDFDLALSTLNRIRPQARLSSALKYYAPYFGDNAEEFVCSSKDFKLVEKLRRCNSSQDTERVLADSFEDQTKPDQKELGVLFSRFKVDPNALRL